MKKLRIEREWGCYPLWLINEDGVPEAIDGSELPISQSLAVKIEKWNKPIVDYYSVMEAIPGGGWSHHSDEEFRTACKKLKLKFPTPQEDKANQDVIYDELKKELTPQGYSIELSNASLGPDLLEKVQKKLTI